MNVAIILAAGRGRRAGLGPPKTYRYYEDVPILRYSVEVFLNHPAIHSVQVVIHPDDQKLYEDAIKGLNLLPVKYGGETRADSVFNALNALTGFDNVLIHDGARPFVSPQVIDRVLDALNHHQGALPALPATDALWEINGEKLMKSLPRTRVVAAQTPQGFHFEKYKSIAKGGDALDDAETAFQAGLDVVWIEGDKFNRKLTFQEDFEK